MKSVFRTVLLAAATAEAIDWISPEFRWLYTQPLPIPAVKQEKWSETPFYHNQTGKPIKYYEMETVEFEQQIYPTLPKTKMRGYDGMFPGPTFIENRGVESVHRITNNLSNNISTHLHGSATRAPWDGWADDCSMPGQYKDYYYPNMQNARTQWYHDHAVHLTTENVYLGLAGLHILQDEEEQGLNLPGPYGVYDIPLVLTSRQYDSNGQIVFPSGERDSIPGDVIHVNGFPWPYFKVEPRKYRFRILNGAVTRNFLLHFDQSAVNSPRVDFQVIASDSGLYQAPVWTDQIYVSNGERYEVVIDFTNYAGKNITLSNTRGQAGETDFLHTDKVMRFIVGRSTTSQDTSTVPDTLSTVNWPSSNSVRERSFTFAKTNDIWTINGVSWDDVQSRILADPVRGSVETWDLINDSDEVHPVHVHLVDFQILSRTGGRNTVYAYESAGLKDVVWLSPSETIKVRAYFGPYPGVYMFHCHNLAHEDHSMMAAFNVTAILEDNGYHDLAFCDPTDAEWAPQWWADSAYAYESIEGRIHDMTDRTPYYLYNAQTGTEEGGNDDGSDDSNHNGGRDTSSPSRPTSTGRDQTQTEQPTVTKSPSWSSQNGNNGWKTQTKTTSRASRFH